jgi:MFS family permease
LNKTELTGALSLASIYMLRMLGLFMVMPVIAVLALDFDDYSPLLLGLAVGGYGLTQAVLQIPMGVLSDRWGRKPIIVVGLLMFAAGSFVAASADTLWLVTVGRLLQGAGAIAAAIMALAGDISRESERPKVMAIIGISIGMSFYIALFLGPLLAGSYGLSGLFLITGVLALACIPLIIFVVPASKERAPKGDTLPRLGDLKSLTRDPSLLRLNMSVLLLHLMISLVFVTLPSMFVELGWELDTHGKLYGMILGGSILGLGVLMPLSKRVGQKPVLLIAIALLLLSFIALTFVSMNVFATLLIVAVFFSGFNYLEANFPALVSSISPAGKKGSAMGIFASCQFFGAFLGGVMSGGISNWLGQNALFWLAALICTIWLGIMTGFRGVSTSNRYTISVDKDEHTLAQIEQKLAELSGVIETTVNAAEKTIYLKVEKHSFDFLQAKQIANSN